MAQYMLSVWHDEAYEVEFTSEDMQRVGPKVGAFNEEADKLGIQVFGAGLMPASSATVVRSAAGEVSMTDGPYAETKEQMGGFWILELADMDAALDWAAKATEACELPVEVRPLQGE
jgi:hypothetical protein